MTTLSPIDSGLMEIITEPLKKKEGFRHLWLGDSGMGKTVANAELLRWIHKKKLIDVTFSIDDKSAWEVQYEGGCLRVNPKHLRQVPPTSDENSKHIVFRGVAATRQTGPEVDEIIFDSTLLAWDVVRSGKCTVLINIDELADATNGNQHWTRPDVGTTYRKGRSVGISLVATTQMPQLLPREAFGLSETIGIFRMTARELDYLTKYRVVMPDEIEALSTLEVGEFRMYRKRVGLMPDTYKFEVK